MESNSFQKIFLLSTVLVFTMLLIVLFNYKGGTQEQSEDEFSQQEVANYRIDPPSVPRKAEFAGEHVPLDRYYVKEDFERELLVNTYWHSSTILLLKRANRWFPAIEPMLKKYGIPDDFKYLALIESGFTKVESPRGAAGTWQLMEKTAKELGLEVNKYVDERYNLELSTKAACEYFLDSYDEYKNWTLVAAAYNAGKRRISESLEEQKADNYYDLYLNEETSRYIYRILAAKTIYTDPAKYGFDLEPDDLYQPLPYTIVEVNESIPDLIAFAHDNKISYRMLKEFNPWLREKYLTDVSGKLYLIKIPDMKAINKMKN